MICDDDVVTEKEVRSSVEEVAVGTDDELESGVEVNPKSVGVVLEVIAP